MDNNILKGIFLLPTCNPTAQMNSSLTVWNFSFIFLTLFQCLYKHIKCGHTNTTHNINMLKELKKKNTQ